MAETVRVNIDVTQVSVVRALLQPNGSLDRYLSRRADTVATRARALCPVDDSINRANSRPGAVHMRDRIRVTRGPGSLQYNVLVDVPYARYVVNDTRPHRITARRATVLRWWDEEGQIHFRYTVWHPGTTRQPFLMQALRDVIK